MSLTTCVTEIVDEALRAGCAPALSCRIVRGDETVVSIDRGVLQTWDDRGAELPGRLREPVTSRTRYDLASLTKVYSALTILQLVEQRILTLDDPAARYLETFATDRVRATITLRHLLTHTSGLPPTWEGWRAPLDTWLRERAPTAPLGSSPLAEIELWGSLLETPFRHVPGDQFDYSCLGYLVAQRVAERATGMRWSQLVQDAVLTPIGLGETGFGADSEIAAATEWQPELGRGVVRGNVHDETSWLLGGRCANAGLFATADDVAKVATWLLDRAPETLRKGMLAPQAVRRTPQNTRTSLGLRMGEPWMADPGHAGHTGFTGTSIEIAPERNAAIVLLTNRVHPSRAAEGIAALRKSLSEALCEEVPDERP